MPDQPFIVNDRRRHTAEGDLRPDAPPAQPKPRRPEAEDSSARLIPTPESSAPTQKGPQAVPNPPAPTEAAEDTGEIPALTADQIDQSTRAYADTVKRLDTAIRAANPGMEPLPEMTFDRLIQSVYMQAMYQLGGTPEQAQSGQTPQVDLLGARQSIDMLAVIATKSSGNLSKAEDALLQSALFEMRMGFLEVTQALARQSAAKAGGAPPQPGPSGPSIVR